MHELEKAQTGIEGFDELTRGGLPRGRSTLVIGSPGSGKTVFALQTLVNGARVFGEPGIFVAFEENSQQIITNAASFGWDLEQLTRSNLFFLDARVGVDAVRTGPFDLTGLLAGLDVKVKEMGARRIVFDSIDVLLTLLNDPVGERQEIYRLHDWFTRNNLTGMVTTRADPNTSPDSQPFGFIQYTTDCTVQLVSRISDRVALREVRILKYRGSAFRGGEFPFVIGSTGIEVAAFGIDAPEVQVYTERVSSGCERLDNMLLGGYLRGTSVLITGAPGTAKSSLSSAFAQAACARGERTLMMSYDEAAAEIVRNQASIGIHLQPHIDSGMLLLTSAQSETGSAEEHLIHLSKLIRSHQPRCLVVDPLSAMIKAGGQLGALSAAVRLIAMTKSMGITSVFTSLLEGPDPSLEATALRISTIADTWIHLSYLVQGGERNRALTIVKSRGTKHSNQVRELVLSDQGISLADIYSAGGSVLMGTLRWEREELERTEAIRRDAELERRRRELELAIVEAKAQVEVLQREAAARAAELETLNQAERARGSSHAAGQDELLRRRGSDDGKNKLRRPAVGA